MSSINILEQVFAGLLIVIIIALANKLQKWAIKNQEKLIGAIAGFIYYCAVLFPYIMISTVLDRPEVNKTFVVDLCGYSFLAGLSTMIYILFEILKNFRYRENKILIRLNEVEKKLNGSDS